MVVHSDCEIDYLTLSIRLPVHSPTSLLSGSPLHTAELLNSSQLHSQLTIIFYFCQATNS